MSPAFDLARLYLEGNASALNGTGASAVVQTQLSMLRVMSINIAERDAAGRTLGFEGRLLTDPATGNRVVFVGGSDPATQGAMVILPKDAAGNEQGGWLMQDGQMIRYQEGEVQLRLNTDLTTGNLIVRAEVDNGQGHFALVLGPDGGFSVNPGFTAENSAATFTADGSLVLERRQGSAIAAAILTGEQAGSTVTLVDRSADGAGMRNVNLGSESDAAAAGDYVAAIDDGHGGVTRIDVRPVLLGTDSGEQVVGSERSVRIAVNGVTRSFVTTRRNTDPASGQTTVTTDTRTFDPVSGALSGRVTALSLTTASGLVLESESTQYTPWGQIAQREHGVL